MPFPAPHDQRSLTQVVKQQAYCLGFALVGVTTPEPPLHLEVYTRWLEAGRQGTMAYLAEPRARQRRADPRLVLPECRSILVLGMPYAAQPGTLAPPAELHRGRVAGYARGTDYHEALPARMKALMTWLEAETSQAILYREYTDTGPLLERELAQRAGLGWIGKNTCLISPLQGSYFLLAEILLDLELEPDAPFTADRCGNCHRCLDACPTQCILPDRTLDARRCISYLTIENKAAIPPELRSQVGDWVFGCDICQQVCPWNRRFAPAGLDQALAGGADQAGPDLVALLALTARDFNRRFKGSAVRRAKRRGLLRSAAVVLGNRCCGQADPAAVTALAQALQDPEALIRQHVAWALGQVGGTLARQALEQAVESEPDTTVQAEIQAALQ